MTPGCIRYQRGYCTDCMPNFKLKGNRCEIDGCDKIIENVCMSCKDGYDLKDGGCFMKNCLEWNNGKC